MTNLIYIDFIAFKMSMCVYFHPSCMSMVLLTKQTNKSFFFHLRRSLLSAQLDSQVKTTFPSLIICVLLLSPYVT